MVTSLTTNFSKLQVTSFPAAHYRAPRGPHTYKLFAKKSASVCWCLLDTTENILWTCHSNYRVLSPDKQPLLLGVMYTVNPSPSTPKSRCPPEHKSVWSEVNYDAKCIASIARPILNTLFTIFSSALPKLGSRLRAKGGQNGKRGAICCRSKSGESWEGIATVSWRDSFWWDCDYFINQFSLL